MYVEESETRVDSVAKFDKSTGRVGGAAIDAGVKGAVAFGVLAAANWGVSAGITAAGFAATGAAAASIGAPIVVAAALTVCAYCLLKKWGQNKENEQHQELAAAAKGDAKIESAMNKLMEIDSGHKDSNKQNLSDVGQALGRAGFKIDKGAEKGVENKDDNTVTYTRTSKDKSDVISVTVDKETGKVVSADHTYKKDGATFKRHMERDEKGKVQITESTQLKPNGKVQENTYQRGSMPVEQSKSSVLGFVDKAVNKVVNKAVNAAYGIAEAAENVYKAATLGNAVKVGGTLVAFAVATAVAVASGGTAIPAALAIAAVGTVASKVGGNEIDAARANSAPTKPKPGFAR